MYNLNTYEYIVYIHVNHYSESILKTAWIHTEYILKTCIVYIMNTSCRSWSRSQLIRNDGRMDQNHETKLWIHGDSLGIHRNFSMKNRYFFWIYDHWPVKMWCQKGLSGWTWLVSTTRSPVMFVILGLHRPLVPIRASSFFVLSIATPFSEIRCDL